MSLLRTLTHSGMFYLRTEYLARHLVDLHERHLQRRVIQLGVRDGRRLHRARNRPTDIASSERCLFRSSEAHSEEL